MDGIYSDNDDDDDYLQWDMFWPFFDIHRSPPDHPAGVARGLLRIEAFAYAEMEMGHGEGEGGKSAG